MMKNIFLVFLFLFFFQFAFSQRMPAFKEVVKQYVAKYETSIDGEFYPKFQKRKDGWYVVKARFENPLKQEDLSLFWSVIANAYKEIYYPRPEKTVEEIEKEFTQFYNSYNVGNDEYQFERNKYFGYDGWDWDIIEEYKNQENLSDSMYESLARAYTNYASGFLSNQYGDLFLNNDIDRKLINDSIAISKSRLKKFIEFVDKGIVCYEKIIKINPSYATKVGNIKLKCANEYVYKYFMLKMCGDTFEISKDLKLANYSDSIIKVAKKYLDNVTKNGILITYGDNDTYPLWYLQVYKNYRKDVVVINNSLLGLKRYLKMLDVEYKGELFSTTSAVYYKKNFEYFLKNENTDSKQAISAATFIKNIQDQQAKKDKTINGRDIVGEPLYNGEPMIQYKNATIFFTGKDKKILKIKLRNYLPMNDFMLIDIINKNAAKRKIYLTQVDYLFEEILIEKSNIFQLAFN